MTASIDDLRHVVRTVPVIDNHAHNLLRPKHLRSSPFLAITSEATGDALQDASKTLAHIRAARQLRILYRLPPDTDWDTILTERKRLLDENAEELTRRCFEGTQTILIDDGLGHPGDFESYHWHSAYTRSSCKRIVRIEAVAASILASLHHQWKLPVGISVADEEACYIAWVDFITAFERAIADAIEDGEVVGFKSVICYRAGLKIKPGSDVGVAEAGLKSFMDEFLPDCDVKHFRVEHRGMNDALVISTCKLIAAGFKETGRAKPIQFHTGLGDNDISLLDSNPSCLQPLIKAFPTVPIVLLHSSYPYTQESGYLATVYKNVYLDIGKVFPMVSRGGQETIVRQALELTPISKILWSTDGHLQAETYWLANVQGREVIEKVFVEMVEAADLTVDQAIEAVKGIFFDNSNILYNLEMSRPDGGAQALGFRTDVPLETQEAQSTSHNNINTSDFEFFLVQWLDYMGTLRCRCIPALRDFQDEQLRFGISRGNLGTLQNDTSTPVCTPVGQIYVCPDMGSLRRMHQGYLPGPAATLIANFEEADGKAVSLCPRGLLTKAVSELQDEFAMQILVGFEIEISFCRRTEKGTGDAFEPLDTIHAWSTLTDKQYTESLPLMMTIVHALQDIDIPVQQTHSESGAGQYEFVLPPLPPVQAIDTLVQAKQCIQNVAATHNLRATCHPQPFPGIGTACHANISLNTSDDALFLEKGQMQFMSYVLAHLPAICAFTLPEAVSYTRVADDTWTSGSWVAWGTQNRETPLRRIATQHGQAARWEVRCLDGMANMYLALYVVMTAGLQGLREETEMSLGDCQVNPSQLTESDRASLGISEKLPITIEQSLAALEEDESLIKVIGSDVVNHYVAMKKAELEMLGAMPEHERHVWLMERY
ncbi:hypothetical protein Q7P37_007272 [Cladosporium fusiforme]